MRHFLLTWPLTLVVVLALVFPLSDACADARAGAGSSTGKVPSDEREPSAKTQQLALFAGAHQVAKRQTDGPFVKAKSLSTKWGFGPPGGVGVQDIRDT